MCVALLSACSSQEAMVIKNGHGLTGSLAIADAGESDGSILSEVYSCSATFAEDGTILSVVWDSVQSRGAFDAEGAVTNGNSDNVLSKKELGDNYGMRAASPIGKEYYEQLAAFEQWAMGKTVSEVLAVPVTDYGSANVEDLRSSCTISIEPFLETLDEAWTTATDTYQPAE